MKILVPDKFSFISYFQFYIYFLFGLMGESLRKRNYRGIQDVILLILFLMPVWMTTTCIALSTMIGSDGATVTRVLVKSSAEAEALTDLGVGGYGFTYFLVMYLPCVLYLIRNRKSEIFTYTWTKKIILPLLLLNFLLGLFTVYKADYVLAILLMALGLAFALFYDSKSTMKRGAFWMSLVGVSVAIPFLILRYITELIQFFWGTSLMVKLKDINMSLVSGKSSGTVSGRTDRYLRSWNMFLDNPFFGTLKKDNLGKHSLIIDMFAQYGVFIGIFFCIAVLYIFFRGSKRSFPKSNLHMTIGVLLFLIMLLNSIGAIMGVAVFLVYPGVIHLVQSTYKVT